MIITLVARARALAGTGLACLLGLALFAAPSVAADVTIGSLRISEPWSPATPSGAKVAVGYFTITNTGTEPDRLVGGSMEVSGRFEIHEMVMTENVMRMRGMKSGLEIKPGQTVVLKPGGNHAMFMDLKQPLKEGQIVKGTLVFEKAGPVAIEYQAAPIGARAPNSGHMQH